MESFELRATGKKLPGKHGQQDLSAARFRRPQTPKRFKTLNFSTWHGIRSVFGEPHGLGEPGFIGVGGDAWESVRCGPEQKGSTTDGECASRRIVTADGSGAAA